MKAQTPSTHAPQRYTVHYHQNQGTTEKKGGYLRNVDICQSDDKIKRKKRYIPVGKVILETWQMMIVPTV